MAYLPQESNLELSPQNHRTNFCHEKTSLFLHRLKNFKAVKFCQRLNCSFDYPA